MVTNGELIEALELYPKDYCVQLSINEESDLMNHMFIDTDNGVIDLSNYIDDDSKGIVLYDAFSNPVTVGTRILLYNNSKYIRCKVTDITSDDEFVEIKACGAFLESGKEYKIHFEKSDDNSYEGLLRYDW